jgi:hypothetical protein
MSLEELAPQDLAECVHGLILSPCDAEDILFIIHSCRAEVLEKRFTLKIGSDSQVHGTEKQVQSMCSYVDTQIVTTTNPVPLSSRLPDLQLFERPSYTEASHRASRQSWKCAEMMLPSSARSHTIRRRYRKA